MFGKKDDFVGKEAFGEGETKPRELKRPGTYYEYNDVRINRLVAVAAAHVQEARARRVPREVMDVIGASNTWRWIPYHNSYVDLDGRKVASVSGGTRWGGGMWINAMDMARFGYLWLRGGKWGDRQVLPPAYVKAAITPSAHGPDYGYLWWLNTQGKNYPGPAGHRLRRPGRRQQHHRRPARPGPGGRVALARRQRGRVREAGGGGDQAGVERALIGGVGRRGWESGGRASHSTGPSPVGWAGRLRLARSRRPWCWGHSPSRGPTARV